MMRNVLTHLVSFIKKNRVAKYIAVSSGLTVLGIALVYVFIVFLDIRAFWASALSDFLCGTLQFMVLRNYIFDGHTTHVKTMIQYIVYCINWVLAIVVVGLLFQWLLLRISIFIPWNIVSIPFAKGFAMLIMFVWNYNFHKYVTYKIK